MVKYTSIALTVAAVLAAALLAGCGSDSGPANADAVKELAKHQPASNNPNVPTPTVDDSPMGGLKSHKKAK